MTIPAYEQNPFVFCCTFSLFLFHNQIQSSLSVDRISSGFNCYAALFVDELIHVFLLKQKYGCNKDEAIKCRRIAEDAIASRNKQRALKFIKLAQRLNHSLSVDDLLADCDKLDLDQDQDQPTSSNINDSRVVDDSKSNGKKVRMQRDEGLNAERSYTEEHVKLIKQIKKNNDYYMVLGLEKTCTVDEIRKAYRKLSLKVHPDKNKAPGSEEAFKKLCRAFKCLSDDNSRNQYDQTGPVEGYEYDQQQSVRHRRRSNRHDVFEEQFDPDEIFRAFFGQTNMFRGAQVYGTNRGMDGQHRANSNDTGPNLMILIQLLPFVLIFFLAYLPFSEPRYSLQQTHAYQILKKTEKYEVDFFVKSAEFDQSYPIGSPDRTKIEDNVIKDYKNLLGRYCNIELQRRQWNRKLPTPHCDKLHSLVA